MGVMTSARGRWLEAELRDATDSLQSARSANRNLMNRINLPRAANRGPADGHVGALRNRPCDATGRGERLSSRSGEEGIT
jgi:hypothetical protein